MVGAVNDSHISIVAPRMHAADYYNCKVYSGQFCRRGLFPRNVYFRTLISDGWVRSTTRTCGRGRKSASTVMMENSHRIVWWAMQRIRAVCGCWRRLKGTKTVCHVRSITEILCKARHVCVSSEHSVCLKDDGEFFLRGSMFI